MVRLDSITKSFGDAVLLENASLHIKPRNRIGLIGANGVGKTTLFRIILDQESVTEGSVFRRGGLRIGYVPQEVENLSSETILSETLSVFPQLAGLEAQLKSLTQQIQHDATDKLLKKLGKLQAEFETLEGYSLETKAKVILCGLGFQEAKLSEGADTLSGGWKMRVALAKVLLQNPDLLLLDEPTNHLDLESLIWLEKFLSNYEGSMVIISHDRYFLDRLVTHIAEISHRRVTTYTGDYSHYEKYKSQRLELLSRQAKNQEKKIAQTERFIERFRAKNTLATRVKSKIKQLEKLERVEVLEDNHKRIKFVFPQPPRSGLKVVELSKVRKTYGALVVYDQLDYTVERGDRIALVGPNGAGKSTLMKLMAEVISPDGGTLKIGHNVNRAYYAQHQQDGLDLQRTVLQNIEGLAEHETVTSVRSYLGAFLFTGDEVNKKVAVLSGGEKARLALARLLINPANFLLLDEPTNHLDIQSQDVLINSLKQYTGTLVVISHDRRFINEICNKVVAIENGRIREYPGNYDYYLWKKNEQEEAAQPMETPVEISSNKLSYEERKIQQKLQRKKQRRIEKFESEIAHIEGRIQGVEDQLKDPANARNYVQLQELMAERSTLQMELDQKYELWVEAQEGTS
ncbi:MAG: ABC-F family ATP-binding cassette domain-containing protein [FCB group bacterium]|nr:ABC-F family ATP-binding cassette domain-containing protein [FCB group bacterium]